MPAEVERVQEEVSEKVDIGNVDEDRQETVGPGANQDVANGISHGGNGIGNGNCNGEDKEETDGSYVFVSEKDTVGDDPVGSDPYPHRIDFVRPSDANVDKDGDGVAEGDNGNSGEQKVEDGRPVDSSLEVPLESQAMAESESEKADDGLEEAVVEITKSEIEGPRDGNIENGEVEKFESKEEVKQIQDSEGEPRDLPDTKLGEPVNLQEKSEGQIESDSKIDVEGDLGNKLEEQDKSAIDIDVSKDLQPSEDVELPVESIEGRASESISDETSLDNPIDGSLSFEQPVQTDSGSMINASESVQAPESKDDGIVSEESIAVMEPVCVERDNSATEADVVKDSASDETGEVQMVSEAENVQLSHDADAIGSELRGSKASAPENDAMPLDSGTTEVDARNVNGEVQAETQNLTVPSLDEDSSKQSEFRVVEVHNSASDAKAELEPEPVDTTASDERSDVVGLAEDNISGTAIADGLSCANQQEPELNGIETPQFPSRLEALPSEYDTNGQVSSEDRGLDIIPETNDESIQVGQEVPDANEKCARNGENQESLMEVNLGTGADVCQNMAEEAESLPAGDHPGNVSHESTETLSTNLDEPVSGLDSETTFSELAENSVEGAADEMGVISSESEAAQSDKTCNEPHVESPTAEVSEVDIEVKNSSKVNVTEDIPSDVCEDTGTEEVCKIEVSDIKESSAMNAAEEVESGTKSFDDANFPLLSNGKVKTVVEEKPKLSWATACFPSATKTSVRDLKPEVAISTDTTHTGSGVVASEAVTERMDSQLAENKGESNAVEIESKTCTSAEDEKDRVDVQTESRCTAGTADAIEAKAASPREDIDGPLVKIQVDGETQKDQSSTSPGEVSASDASEGQTLAAEVERKSFYFFPRVPRYDDEKLSEQLKHAEEQVDQKTESRDAIRAEIQKIRVSCKEYDGIFKEALAEERSARKALHSKRQEIESLQSVINRVKSAVSVDDINSKVHNMEHMIQHETLHLNEEKRLIREIKQLKQLREQISSNMGTQDEVQQALDDKDKTEERLKILRKELDMLRNDLSKDEAVTKASRKMYDDEWEKQAKLQEQFRAADAVRQEAFVHLQSLRKQLREKNKYFFKYRDDLKAANEMALKKDREALQSLCLDQVETFMNMWNNDDEFRKYYIRCNTRSTLRRLGTLDGRSLGPDEEPTQITHVTRERADRLRTSNVRPEKHETLAPVSAQQEKVVHFEDAKVESTKGASNSQEQKTQTTKSKKPAKSTPPPVSLASVSGREEIEESATEDEQQPKLTKAEEELLRKAEEKRKLQEAAKLKEQRRLEEIAKAKEAMERKKKREEKAKARAALRAQKEAEEREKEREKKLRKKERKCITVSEDTATQTPENPLPTSDAQSETPKETESAEKQIATNQPKKSHKPSQFLKQNKSKSVPLPLRNRSSKRRLKQWMWVALATLLVLALFLLGKANLSFSPANLWFLI